jgi:hypothetical protein
VSPIGGGNGTRHSPRPLFFGRIDFIDSSGAAIR